MVCFSNIQSARAAVFGLIVTLLTFALPDPDEAARRKFPVERLNAAAASLTIAEILAEPEASWQADGWRPPSGNWTQFREIWRRVRIDHTQEAPPGTRLVADFSFLALQEVEFHIVNDGRIVESRFAGIGRDDTNDSPPPGPSWAFPFTVPERGTTALYVRIGNALDLHGFLTVRRDTDHYAYTQRRIILLSLLIGAALAILLYNTMSYALMRRPGDLMFLLVHGLMIFSATSLSGLGYSMVPPAMRSYHWNSVWLNESFLLACILFMAFLRQYLSIERNFPRLVKHVRAGQLTAAVAMIVVPFSPPTWSILLVGILNATLLIAMIGHLMRFVSLGKMSRLLLYFGLMQLTTFIAEGAILGLYPSTPIIENFHFIGVLWMGLFMTSEVADRVKVLTDQYKQIVSSLQGSTTRHQLNAILGDTYAQQLHASEMHVSIVFIDIVAFSTLAQQKNQDDVFAQLSQQLAQISTIIKRHGGSIDRSLGDGMVCFFGYDPPTPPLQHAQAAFQAAIEIQNFIVDRATALRATPDEAKREMLLPVRIGLHTDRVMIGNLGGDVHVDFSMIGQGVILAHRLEAACSPFRILLSEDVRELLVGNHIASDQLVPTHIAVKHQATLLRAYEFDPFAGDQATLRAAENLFHEQAGIRRRDRRSTARSPGALCLTSDYGDFDVLDYSATGFRAFSKSFLGRNAVIEARLVSADPEVRSGLEDQLLADLTVEVRWSRRTPGGFEHGLRIVGGSRLQHQARLALLECRVAA